MNMLLKANTNYLACPVNLLKPTASATSCWRRWVTLLKLSIGEGDTIWSLMVLSSLLRVTFAEMASILNYQV